MPPKDRDNEAALEAEFTRWLSTFVGRDLSQPKERLEFLLDLERLRVLRQREEALREKKRLEVRGIIVGVFTAIITGSALWIASWLLTLLQAAMAAGAAVPRK